MSTDPCNLKKLLSNFLLKVVDAVCVGCPVELLVEAQGSVNFDPGYQRLTFHTLNVIRGGKVLGRLGSTRIQVLQRETELEYLIYDGSMTASTMLDDVRIGDIVEYAYSIAGSNPVFRNHAAGTLSLAWSVPLERAYTRLLMPAARSSGVAAGAARNLVSRHRSGRRLACAVRARAGLSAPLRRLQGQGAADGVAHLFQPDDGQALQYVDYYGRSYPGLVAAGPPAVQDGPERNTLTVLEKYRISAIGTLNKAKKRREVDIELSDIEDLLKAPEMVNRSMPLKIAYPYELVETAEVLLPRDWNLKPFKKVAEHPAFDFSFEVSQSDDGRRLLINADRRRPAVTRHRAAHQVAGGVDGAVAAGAIRTGDLAPGASLARLVAAGAAPCAVPELCACDRLVAAAHAAPA